MQNGIFLAFLHLYGEIKRAIAQVLDTSRQSLVGVGSCWSFASFKASHQSLPYLWP